MGHHEECNTHMFNIAETPKHLFIYLFIDCNSHKKNLDSLTTLELLSASFLAFHGKKSSHGIILGANRGNP